MQSRTSGHRRNVGFHVMSAALLPSRGRLGEAWDMRHSTRDPAKDQAAPLIVLGSERRFLNEQWDRPPPRTAPSYGTALPRVRSRIFRSVARATIGRIYCAVKSKPLPDAVSTAATVGVHRFQSRTHARNSRNLRGLSKSCPSGNWVSHGPQKSSARKVICGNIGRSRGEPP